MSLDIKDDSTLNSPRSTDQKSLEVDELTGNDGLVLSRQENLSSIFGIICAGFALISDGLQNNIMSLTNPIFAQIYGTAYTAIISTQISNALTVGTILGQLSIGLLVDLKGRKYGIVVSTLSIVVGVILFTAAHASTLTGFFWFLTIARGLTGLGVGGEYCSSSSTAIEAADARNVKTRAFTFIMVTNLVLSCGGILASSLFLIVFSAGGGVDGINLNMLWRVVAGISIIPPLAVFIFRMRMLNSKLYVKNAIQKNVPYLLMFKYYGKSLFGTAGSWLLYDLVAFANGAFSGTIIASIVNVKGPALIQKTAEYQMLLGAIALPGVFVGAVLMNKIGRRNTMMLGFTGYLVFGLSVGLAYDRVVTNIPLFIFLYGMMTSFGNLGPGDSLGLISSESYATPVRGTLYGISAAFGKVGAVIGTQTFIPIRNNLGAKYTFIVAAAVGVAGVLVTFFFVRNDLDGDLSLEDDKFAAYLTANGWTGTTGVENVTLNVESIEEQGKTAQSFEDSEDKK